MDEVNASLTNEGRREAGWVDFEQYVSEQGQSLLRLAYVLTNDAHHAEDLTQTVLADLYRKWSKVASAEKPDAYVRRSMVNAHLSWRRRRSSTEVPSALITELEPSRSPDPGERASTRSTLRQGLATLPARARTALVLRYYADLDDAAIADAMGISQSTVRSTIARALERLRTGGAMESLKGEHR